MFDNRWDNWAGDFAESFAAGTFDPPTRDQIPAILHHLGDGIRRIDPDFPDAVAAGTFATVFAEHLPRLTVTPTVRADIPEVVARFFEYLQDGGRLGDGHAWAEQVRRLEVPAVPARPARPAAKVAPIRNTPQTAVGRNDPCPCGSGKKYKQCHDRRVAA